MTQEIPLNPLISRSTLPDLQQSTPAGQKTKHAADKEAAAGQLDDPQRSGYLRTALGKISAGREYSDDQSFKAFTHLSRSLEQAFSAAPKVDHVTGETEMRQGGIRRIDKDLRKLFKGLGLPPQLAKQLSRNLADEMGRDDVEQLSFSLTDGRSLSLQAQQKQQTYLPSGDGRAVAKNETNHFQISAIQLHAVDISINLRTGEYTLNRSSLEAYSVDTSGTTTLANYPPVAQADEPNPNPALSDDVQIAALVQKDESLRQISNTVQQSAIMQLAPTGNQIQADAANDSYSTGMDSLQELVERLEEMAGAVDRMFEPIVQVRDLRIEPEENDAYLRFAVDAQAPVGLSVTNETGRDITIYPRPDGSLGKLVSDPFATTA